MKTTFGPVQGKIIACLSMYMDTVTSLARRVYELKLEAQPTRSQRETIRRALRDLDGNGFVRLTNQLRKRERCWELTGKVVPEKPKPTRLAKKPLAVVK